MKWRHLIALFLGLMSLGAWAADYGSLRISVLGVNPDHRTNVQLKLNGQNFAAFSHSLNAPLVKAISEQFLAQGTSTPMSSDYGSLQGDCQFKFKVEFFFEGVAPIPLGEFDAPGQGVSVALPIGLCDGSLCSSSPTVKAKLEEIEQERWKRNGEALKKWLQDAVDSEAQMAREQKGRIEKEEPPRRDDKGLLDDATTLQSDAVMAELDPDIPLNRFSEDEWWQVRVDAALAQGTTDAMLAQMEHNERFYAACAAQGPKSALYCARYGGYAWLVASGEAIYVLTAANRAEAVSEMEARFRVMADGPSLADVREKNAQMRLTVLDAVAKRRSEEIWAQVGTVARMGVSLSPLNDVADFCEAVTGREFCNPNGRLLNRDERLFAILGVIAGDRLLWEKLGPDLKRQILGTVRDPDGLANALERFASSGFTPRGASHILGGELESLGGKTLIRGGMHVEDVVQGLIALVNAEGRTLQLTKVIDPADLVAEVAEGKVLKYVDKNGVALYKFPPSAFAPKMRDRNVADVAVDGAIRRIDDAKTVFPENWSYDRLAEALTHVKNNPTKPPVGTERIGAFGGVPIRVGLEGDKIHSAYPIATFDP